MKNLEKMLREINLERNTIKDIRFVLNFIANELNKKINDLYNLKKYIKSTQEYYSDGVDEELEDIIGKIIGKENK